MHDTSDDCSGAGAVDYDRALLCGGVVELGGAVGRSLTNGAYDVIGILTFVMFAIGYTWYSEGESRADGECGATGVGEDGHAPKAKRRLRARLSTARWTTRRSRQQGRGGGGDDRRRCVA